MEIRTFVLHIEWQVKNDKLMVYRIMLLRKYSLPVKQYVLYIDKGKPAMKESIEEEDFSFRYHIIALSQIDYKLFLQSKEPEEKILAILAHFGDDKEENVIKAILQQIRNDTDSDLTAGKYFNQLRVLAQLRNLTFKLNDMLDSISTFFKPEKAPFFKLGIEQGIEQEGAKKSREFVTNLIQKFGFNDYQAADATYVSIKFVEEVRKSLSK